MLKPLSFAVVLPELPQADATTAKELFGARITSNGVEVLSDNSTVVTKDKKASAHFEHTVHVTDNGPEILTKLL